MREGARRWDNDRLARLATALEGIGSIDTDLHSRGVGSRGPVGRARDENLGCALEKTMSTKGLVWATVPWASLGR